MFYNPIQVISICKAKLHDVSMIVTGLESVTFIVNLP